MSDDPLAETVRIRRKTASDEVELELVSTAMLEQILTSDDAARRQRLESAAQQKDGLLAQNLASGDFEIIDDEDLKLALEQADATDSASADVVYDREIPDNPEQELSLVSTQALRKLLGSEEPDSDSPADMPGGGFDPYNKG